MYVLKICNSKKIKLKSTILHREEVSIQKFVKNCT